MMQDSAPSRFIQIANTENLTVIDERDGVDSCYYVNSRYCDKILSEIADSLNIKGSEQSFDFVESKKILLTNLLELHHAMINWSKLTQRRYEAQS